MKYTVLPTTDIKVSKLCLGTMTFGNQNTEAEGHAQMDLAVERGINFLTQPNYIQYQPLQQPMPIPNAF